MLKLLLILTVFLSLTQGALTQVASAERWRGLIASVIALESAKEPVTKEPTVTKEPATKEPICKNGSCRLTSPASVNTKRALITKKRPFKMQWLRRIVGKD